MKAQLMMMTLAAVFGFQAQAATELKGDWTLKNRECVSGKIPQDAFVVGRDSLEVNIATSNRSQDEVLRLKGAIRINGKESKYLSSVTRLGIAHELVNPITGKKDLMIYNQPTPDTLQIFTAGFGPDGSCPSGDRLKATFERVAPVKKQDIQLVLFHRN